MKTVTVIGADKVTESATLHKAGNDLIIEGDDNLSVSDGYHTFDELYEHRIELWITVCRLNYNDPQYHTTQVWRSKLHSDGSSFDGWFILGITTPSGKQLSYHLPISKWEETEFAPTLEKAPEFDGHTSQDVLERLKQL